MSWYTQNLTRVLPSLSFTRGDKMAKVTNLNWPTQYEKYLKKVYTVKVRKGNIVHIEPRPWWGKYLWAKGRVFTETP